MAVGEVTAGGRMCVHCEPTANRLVAWINGAGVAREDIVSVIWSDVGAQYAVFYYE